MRYPTPVYILCSILIICGCILGYLLLNDILSHSQDKLNINLELNSKDLMKQSINNQHDIKNIKLE